LSFLVQRARSTPDGLIPNKSTCFLYRQIPLQVYSYEMLFRKDEMKKLIVVIFSFLLLSSPAVFADFGDVYNCKTLQISEITEYKASTNFNTMTFSFVMENGNLDIPGYIGSITFDQNVIGTLVDNEFGRTVFMDTHVKPERVMASMGTTKVWFNEGDLSISSMYKDDNLSVIKIFSSMSKCYKK